jgi:primary-amine oxidase
VKIIRQEMKEIVDKKTRFYRLQLIEPEKKEILAYDSSPDFDKPEIARKSFCVMLAQGKTYEVRVNLSEEKLINYILIENVQPSLIIEDYELAEKIVKEDPRVIEALQKRGIMDMDLVMVDTWTTGPLIYKTDTPDRRLMRPLLWTHRFKDDNGYAYPIQGINILVDIGNNVVAEIKDFEVKPLPPIDPYSEYDEERVRQVLPDHPWREPPKKLVITQPDGPSFKVDGSKVEWQGWEFRVGFNAREGLVLHQIHYNDPDKNFERRPIGWRFSVPEMVVPYGKRKKKKFQTKK